jgi:hypothetical protein
VVKIVIETLIYQRFDANRDEAFQKKINQMLEAMNGQNEIKSRFSGFYFMQLYHINVQDTYYN